MSVVALPPASVSAPSSTPPKRLDGSILDALGHGLRQLYERVEDAPLNDDLRRLIAILRKPTPEQLEGVREGILQAVPSLRAFAISLSGSVDRADDLVQETMLRAFGNIEKFTPGTSLQAWLFTILRNLFHSEHRRRKREVEDPDGVWAGGLAVLPDQEAHLDLSDFRTAFATLSSDQREALVLVGAEGFTYEEAADICGVPVGTVKSRVNRARRRLASILSIDDVDDLSADRRIQAVLVGAAGGA